MRILIVDDSFPIVEALQFLFSVNDVDFMSAITVSKAIKLLESFSFDVIITDLDMPNYTGIELSLLARKLQQTSFIIIFTAQPFEKEKYESSLNEIGNIDFVGNKDLTKLMDVFFDYVSKKTTG